ncbi:uncharacterized protein LOC129597385 [Paramacrobiotus metropolitanus]|uniref:uncharacterized protein LOC129597385 n=1 Tax=Paramacrobiotus metropolitanus TaxID=2943436 RepID=UPI0024459B61|nr:uncharacterized protein LOC129597385 [Paramacrobiotus metropolitanus]
MTVLQTSFIQRIDRKQIRAGRTFFRRIDMGPHNTSYPQSETVICTPLPTTKYRLGDRRNLTSYQVCNSGNLGCQAKAYKDVSSFSNANRHHTSARAVGWNRAPAQGQKKSQIRTHNHEYKLGLNLTRMFGPSILILCASFASVFTADTSKYARIHPARFLPTPEQYEQDLAGQRSKTKEAATAMTTPPVETSTHYLWEIGRIICCPKQPWNQDCKCEVPSGLRNRLQVQTIH